MRVVLQILVGVAVLTWMSVDVWADGGQVRASETAGEYRITVFTSPQPLRAGPVDVSVLVENAETGGIAADATVIVELSSSDRSFPPLRAAATPEAATNKLLRSALFELPSAGQWRVCVTTEIPGGISHVTRFAVEAAPPLPAWLTFWPWMLWPIVAVVLFVIHRRLVSRRPPVGRTAYARSECGRVGSLPIVELAPIMR